MEQNRTQNETKNKMIFEMQKVTLQDRLGAVLGRFGGPPACHFCCFSIDFCMISCKSTFSNQVGVQERSGCPKGRFGEPKWTQNRSKLNVPTRTFFPCKKGGFGTANWVGVGDTFGPHGNPFGKLGYRFR